MRSLFQITPFSTIFMLVMVLVVGIIVPSAKAGTVMPMSQSNYIQTEAMQAEAETGSLMPGAIDMSGTYCQQNRDNVSDIDCVLSCATICVSSVYFPALQHLNDLASAQSHSTPANTGNFSFALALATPPPRI